MTEQRFAAAHLSEIPAHERGERRWLPVGRARGGGEVINEHSANGPELAETARTDPDLAAARDDPRFESAVPGKPDTPGPTA